MTSLLGLLGVEAALLWYASATVYRLRGVVIMNMMMITLFAAKLVEVGGYTTNLGNALYVGAVSAQTMMLARGHQREMIGTIRMALFALVFSIAVSFAIGLAPIVPGNETAANAIAVLTNYSVKVVAASLIAFSLSQMTLLKVFEAFPAHPVWARWLYAQFVAQSVDSVIFFPIAFMAIDPHVIEIGVTGFAVKCAMTAMLLPLLWLNRMRHA